MRIWIVAFVLWVAAGLLPGEAAAHEQAIGFTDMAVFTGEGGDPTCAASPCRIEVAHRLSIHDAESTLMALLGARADLVGDPAAQEKLEAYVAERFSMIDLETGKPIELTLLGGEVERGYYWVYQESLTPSGVSDISISQSVLMDAIPRQTNRVNIRHHGAVKTLTFSGNARAQSFSFR